MKCYGESGIIGVVLEKWAIIPDYGHLDLYAQDEDPSLPAIVRDEWLELHVERAGRPEGSRGL